MDANTQSAILPYIAGPASAVIVLLIVLLAVYKLMVEFLIPMIQKAVDAHIAQITALTTAIRETGADTQKQLTSMDKKIERIDLRVARLDGATDSGVHPDGSSRR